MLHLKNHLVLRDLLYYRSSIVRVLFLHKEAILPLLKYWKSSTAISKQTDTIWKIIPITAIPLSSGDFSPPALNSRYDGDGDQDDGDGNGKGA